ncbi:RagB/SusD family nutrient uptake outer membrane protein [Cognataquiflexum rubidum]|uniref:RagB/SusD family nutrient uptake outer membrane protein n=1 Tax=Cognataquiflexum rubidum TaxID=2922273 RepID=UPI001F12A0AE|nr:RagB/SusD family nutrient uptake outer membrane protein [Cognataquiflexum rubidum]MCH6235193.1 RagB/SusD family nutrient uptake outer membrane protein [Cognataquiflexum rubidum]
MKKYIIIGLLGLVTVFSSCNDELFLTPFQSIDQDLALSNDANVKSVLIGAYAEMRSVSLYGGRLQLYSEMLGANGEIRWEGTFNQPREMFNKSIVVNNSFVEGTWAAAYRVINVSNNVLASLEVVDEEDRDRVKGEALFLRGSMYFELIKLYGLPYVAGNLSTNLGVPIVLTPTRGINEESFVSRNTVAEVYAQVLSDLTEAEPLLPPTNGFFANSYVTAAQLSRVYLQMERFADARDAANRAILLSEANGKRLVTNFMDAFNTNGDSPEDLFAIQVNTQDPDNDMFTFYSLPEFGARDGDVAILTNHLNGYESNDDRLTQFFTGAGELRTAKWRDQFKNVKVIRLTEMYLTRAEANFRENTAIGATPLVDINRIRARVILPAKTSLTLGEILKERRLELAHEGHIIHDVKRVRGSINDNTGSDVFPFDSPRMVFPIPQREMDANPNLVQNPGY